MAAVPSPATQAMRGFKDMQPLPGQCHIDAAEGWFALDELAANEESDPFQHHV